MGRAMMFIDVARLWLVYVRAYDYRAYVIEEGGRGVYWKARGRLVPLTEKGYFAIEQMAFLSLA